MRIFTLYTLLPLFGAAPVYASKDVNHAFSWPLARPMQPGDHIQEVICNPQNPDDLVVVVWEFDNRPPPFSRPDDVIKTCGCGIKYTAASWAKLPFAGNQADPFFEGDTTYLELRNCRCGSTIAILGIGLATIARSL